MNNDMTLFHCLKKKYAFYFKSFQANAVGFRVIVRDVKTLQIVHLFTCLDAVQKIEVWRSIMQAEISRYQY